MMRKNGIYPIKNEKKQKEKEEKNARQSVERRKLVERNEKSANDYIVQKSTVSPTTKKIIDKRRRKGTDESIVDLDPDLMTNNGYS
jgi:hypothetical protein